MATGPRLRFQRVDSLRAIAALSVLLYHAVYKGILRQGDAPLRAWAMHWDVGVSIFFVISGFLLYRPFVAARLSGAHAPDTNDYGWRRLLRIVPGYWVALVVAGIAALSYHGYAAIFSAKGAPAYFGFLQIYSPNTAQGGINTAWTLCVEVTFYIFLPVWASMVRRMSPRGGLRSEIGALAALFLASTAWQVFALSRVDPSDFGAHAAPWIQSLPNFLDQFAIGMAAATATVAWQRGAVPRAAAWLKRFPDAGLLAAALAFWAMAHGIGLTGSPHDQITSARYLAQHELETVVAAGLLLLAIIPGRRGLAPRLLRSRALIFLGAISYGIYLYQVPLMLGMMRLGLKPGAGLLQNVAWVAVAVLGSIVAGWLSYRLVERPALRWRKRPPRTLPQPAPDVALQTR